jgi:cytochrome c
MRPGLIAAVLAAAALPLAGCGKSSTNKTADAQQANAGAQTGAPEPPPMSPEDQQKALAKLPAPYNTADLGNGEAKFGLCKTCHTLAAGGANMTGPNLHGIIGQKAGLVPGFKFSDAMLASHLTWDPPTLDKWLTKPSDLVPGTKMTFPGFNDPKDRTDVIAYLMVNTGS